MNREFSTAGPHPDRLRYNEDAALQEAQQLQQLAGEGRDLPEAEWMTDVERFRKLEYLELQVDADLQPLIERVNADFGLELAPRQSGFHLTIVGPSERKVLETTDANQLTALRQARESLRDGQHAIVRGLGFINAERRQNLRTADQAKQVLYIAMDIPGVQELRAALGLPPKDFHITLGFVGGDVHMAVEGTNEKGKPILSRIPKQAEPDLEAYTTLIPEVHIAGFFSGPSLGAAEA